MRYVLFTFLFLISQDIVSQSHISIGDLKLVNAKIIKRSSIIDEVCGVKTKVTKLTIKARTEVQLFCAWGNPSLNQYDTVDNFIYLYYTIDTSGLIRQAVLNEIAKYVEEQEIFSSKYNIGKNFEGLPFEKSFYLNENDTIPFISTGAENVDDYQMFYLKGQVYKFAIKEINKRISCLSCFVEQNVYFQIGDKKLILGETLKNIDQVKQILYAK